MSDLISRADAIDAICDEWCYVTYGNCPHCDDGYKCDGCDDVKRLKLLPSAEAEKKKAELKENGDWDCPDVGCDECDHHRSVEWCSLAIPNHEKEIDETYKMVNEAFFEGFDAAEKRYRFLIEYVEELDKKSADAVTIHEDGTLEVKVPNAQKVGRVLVMDVDSHIGGGLFYQDDAEAEWISVSKRLPKEYAQYLVCLKSGECYVYWLEDCDWARSMAEKDGILAWMPLPKPYKAESEEV